MYVKTITVQRSCSICRNVISFNQISAKTIKLLIARCQNGEQILEFPTINREGRGSGE